MLRAKVLVIGLDSGSWRLMAPLMEDGSLPHLSRLVENGARGVLRSVVPPVTAVAWPSFLTGKNPGKHGLFSFMKRRPGTYEMMPSSALDLRAETLADILSRHGRRVALVNVPMTYPPRSVNGIVVTGLDTPSVESDFTFPAELRDELLHRFGYEIEYSDPVREGRERAFIKQVVRVEEKRARASQALLEQGDWDLFAVVFRGTDVLPHYFWRAQDRSHPGYDAAFAQEYGQVLSEHYQVVDGIVGRLVQAAGEGCTVVIMSDHGAAPLRRKVYLDNWLLREGLMALKRSPGARVRGFMLERGITISNAMRLLTRIGLWGSIRRLVGRETRLRVTGKLFGSTAIDWANTSAYPVGIVGAISINLAGREALGTVAPGADYERVRERIRDGLLELRDPDTGEPVVSDVLRREEVYSGPCLADAPDLIIAWRDDAYKATFILGESNTIFSPVLDGSYSGFHTRDGIMIVAGPETKRGLTVDGAEIVDVAPTILALLGLPVPKDMDGRVLTEVFARAVGVRYEAVDRAITTSEQDSPSAEDEALVTERLRALGYL